MAKTFCNTPVNAPGRHQCDVGGRVYIMSPYWIDTASPRDMMDYDQTMPIHEAKELHEDLRLMNLGF